jgi:hypothetical protein
MSLSNIILLIEEAISGYIQLNIESEQSDESRLQSLFHKMIEIIQKTHDQSVVKTLTEVVVSIEEDVKQSSCYQLFKKICRDAHEKEILILRDGIDSLIKESISMDTWLHLFKGLWEKKIETVPLDIELQLAVMMLKHDRFVQLSPSGKQYITILRKGLSLENTVSEIRQLFGHPLANIGIAQLTLLGVSWKEMSKIRDININDLAPYLKVFNCDGCDLINLPALPNCLILSCQFCKRLKLIENLPKCVKLVCDKSWIVKIKELPNCTQISCKYCVSLKSIDKMSNCNILIATGCINLISIGELENSIKVDFSLCSGLQRFTISSKKLKQLVCDNCPFLEMIHISSNQLRFFSCMNCPYLESIPEINSDTEVFCDDRLFPTRLKVDLDKLKAKPEKYLLKVGKYTSKRRAFPKIFYFNNGIQSRGVDLGGIRRDFVTRLLEHLFDGKVGSSLPVIMGEQGVSPRNPEFKKHDSYCIVGNIFAMCYLGNNDFVTGPMFNPLLFEVLKITGIADGEEVAILKAGLVFNELPLELVDWIKGRIALGGFTPEVIDKIAILLDVKKEKIFYHRKTLKELLLADGCVYAAVSIAQGMRNYLGEDRWLRRIQYEASEVLKTKIEGELTRERVKEKLVFSDPLLKGKRTKKFLITWIDQADKQSLKKFVRAISSNNALSNAHLHIHFYSRGSGFIPVAHTCVCALELSSDYGSQENFNKKMETFLAEGLAGDGFSER